MTSPATSHAVTRRSGGRAQPRDCTDEWAVVGLKRTVLTDKVYEQVRRSTSLRERVVRGRADDRALHVFRRGRRMLLQVERSDAGDNRRRVRVAAAGERRGIAGAARARHADAGGEEREARTVVVVRGLVVRIAGGDGDRFVDPLRRERAEVADAARGEHVDEAGANRFPDRLVEIRLRRLPPHRAHIDDGGLGTVGGDPVDSTNGGGAVGSRRAVAREDAQRVDARRRGDAECPTGEDAGHVRAVPLRARRIAVVGLAVAGVAADEVADPLSAAFEFLMRAPHAAVDDVHVDAAAVAVAGEAAVEWQLALIDAIETPRDPAGCVRDL